MAPRGLLGQAVVEGESPDFLVSNDLRVPIYIATCKSLAGATRIRGGIGGSRKRVQNQGVLCISFSGEVLVLVRSFVYNNLDLSHSFSNIENFHE